MTITPTKQSRGQANNTPTDEDLIKHRQDLGLIGKLIGGRENAPISVAFLIIFLSLFGILSVLLSDQHGDVSDAEAIKVLSSLIFASITFLGGYVSGKGS